VDGMRVSRPASIATRVLASTAAVLGMDPIRLGWKLADGQLAALLDDD
jgi:hypothetical protein